MPQTVRKEVLKDIATGIAITSVLFAASIKSPVLGFFCTFLVPLPTFFYRSKFGRTIGIAVPGFTIIAMIIILGGYAFDVFFFIELLLIGFVLSELIELKLSIEKTFIYACIVVLSSSILVVLFYSNITGIQIGSLVSDYIVKNLELTLELYKNMGMPEENIHMISSSMESFQYVLIRIFPALAIASTLFIIWTSLMLAKPLLKTRNLFYPDFGQLNLWKTPEYFVWIAIACGILLLIPDKTVRLMGINGIIILMTIYFFQGMAIVSFYFAKKQFPRLLRFFLYSLIAIWQVILLIVVILGFFDIWFNFRKIQIKKS
ncbi:MAG: YybS family protein [Deltaproteobacteria bacterium]|nr:YybS family protein [Deltaproteobacteria bacterium]